MNCNYNEITKSGAVALVESVGLIQSVEVLQLDGNNLGEEGIYALVFVSKKMCFCVSYLLMLSGLLCQVIQTPLNEVHSSNTLPFNTKCVVLSTGGRSCIDCWEPTPKLSCTSFGEVHVHVTCRRLMFFN